MQQQSMSMHSRLEWSLKAHAWFRNRNEQHVRHLTHRWQSKYLYLGLYMKPWIALALINGLAVFLGPWGEFLSTSSREMPLFRRLVLAISNLHMELYPCEYVIRLILIEEIVLHEPTRLKVQVGAGCHRALAS